MVAHDEAPGPASDERTTAHPAAGPRSAPRSVAHLTSVHPPFDVRIFEKECVSLARSGRRVSLICRHGADETVKGVHVRAVPDISRSRLRRMFVTSARIYREAMRSGAEICHFHDPELIPLGLLLKARGRRVVYDVHEDVPQQILHKAWIPAPARKIVAAAAGGMERLAGKVFDGIVAATPAIAARFPAASTVTIQNYPILGELDPPSPVPYRDRANNVVYIGGITQERGARQMAEAIRSLGRDAGVTLHLAGPFMPALLSDELRICPENREITYHGVLNREGVRDLLGSARAGLVTLQPSPRYLDAYPVKLFEYWAAGIPVVASDFPLWRSIVDGAQAGLLVDPTDPKAIAGAIAWLISNPAEAEAMGRCGQAAVREQFNWPREEFKLVEFYDSFEQRSAENRRVVS